MVHEQTTPTFDDLLTLRKGGPKLTEGGGPSSVAGIETVEEWQRKAAALRELFRQTLGRCPFTPSPLDPEVIEETDRGDHTLRTIEYTAAPDERFRAYALIPKALTAKTPGVLCIHPTTEHGKEQPIGNDTSEKGRDRAYALHLARRGYVTLAYDLYSAGTRCNPGLRHFDTAPFYEEFPEWSVRGRDLWDAARAVDLLQSLDEVDPERIGSIGHSQGGGITIHAMSLDERIKVGVSSCGSWPERLAKNPFNHARTAWWVGRPALRPYCATGKPFPIAMQEHLALAAPRALMNIMALNDCQYDLDEAEFVRASLENMAERVAGVFALTGRPDNFRNVLHCNGHGFIAEQRRAAYAFLDEKLCHSPADPEAGL